MAIGVVTTDGGSADAISVDVNQDAEGTPLWTEYLDRHPRYVYKKYPTTNVYSHVVMCLLGLVSLLVGKGSNLGAATIHGSIAIAALVAARGYREHYIDGGYAQLLCSRVVEPVDGEERRMFLNMEYTEEGCPSIDVLALLVVIETVTALAHVWYAVSREYAIHMGVERREAGAEDKTYINNVRWMLEFPITAPGIMAVALIYAGQRNADVLIMTTLSLIGMTLMGSAVERPVPQTAAERATWGFIHRVATWTAPAFIFVGYLIVMANAWKRVQTASDDGTIPDLPSFVPPIIKAEIAALCLFPLISLGRKVISHRATEASWILASYLSKVPLALVILFAQRK